MKTVVLDIETSGLVPKGATYETDFDKFPYILSIGWKINDESVKEFFINQEGRKIPPEATKINGITDEMCEAGESLGNVLSKFLLEACDNDYVIGHNLYFDSSIIKANVLRLLRGATVLAPFYEQLCLILDKDKRIDTMRAGIPLVGKWPKLTELYKKLFREEFEAHSAGADCEACYKCYVKMVEMDLIKYPVRKGEDI